MHSMQVSNSPQIRMTQNSSQLDKFELCDHHIIHLVLINLINLNFITRFKISSNLMKSLDDITYIRLIEFKCRKNNIK